MSEAIDFNYLCNLASKVAKETKVNRGSHEEEYFETRDRIVQYGFLNLRTKSETYQIPSKKNVVNDYWVLHGKTVEYITNDPPPALIEDELRVCKQYCLFSDGSLRVIEEIYRCITYKPNYPRAYEEYLYKTNNYILDEYQLNKIDGLAECLFDALNRMLSTAPISQYPTESETNSPDSTNQNIGVNMEQYTPSQLLDYARNAAKKIKIPPQIIELKKSKTRNVNTSSSKTKQESQIYSETETYPVNGWIIDKYFDRDCSGDGITMYSKIFEVYYVLKVDGSLKVIEIVRTDVKEGGQIFDINYETPSEKDMTFQGPTKFLIPKISTNLMSLLHERSVYLLDVKHKIWITNRTGNDYIERNYPMTLTSEEYDSGSGEYEHLPSGRGLIVKLEKLIENKLSDSQESDKQSPTTLQLDKNGLNQNSNASSFDIIEGKVYRIKSKSSGLFMDAIGPTSGYGDGNAVGIWEYTGRINQQWKVIKGNKGYFRLMNMTNISSNNDSNGKVIDIDGGQNMNGTKVHMWENSYRNNNQDLLFVKAADGSYSIRTGASKGTKCLDICDWKTSSGSLVHQWDIHGGANQQWFFESI